MLWEDTHTRRKAAASTYDAVLYELRTYGLPQLGKAACQRRLAELSSRQVKELIAALRRQKAKGYEAITDDLIAKLEAQL
jgi:hypothetical protein